MYICTTYSLKKCDKCNANESFISHDVKCHQRHFWSFYMNELSLLFGYVLFRDRLDCLAPESLQIKESDRKKSYERVDSFIYSIALNRNVNLNICVFYMCVSSKITSTTVMQIFYMNNTNKNSKLTTLNTSDN